MSYIVYKITNLVNDKIYVGQTTDYRKRVKQHCKYPTKGSLIDKAIQKYGTENFLFEVIEEVSSLEQLNEREKYWIAELKSRNIYGNYNIRLGGKNTPHADETRKKIGDSQRGELNHMWGKFGADNPTSKPVVDLTDGRIYVNATECSTATGLGLSKICAVCRGDRFSTGGRIFRYVDEDQNFIPVNCNLTSRCGYIFYDENTNLVYISPRHASKTSRKLVCNELDNLLISVPSIRVYTE